MTLADSSKSSSSEKFGHPESMGVQNGYGHQAVQCEPKWWVMQEEYPHSTLCSPVMHSGSIDEYYPEVSMGIHSGSTWHEVSAQYSLSFCSLKNFLCGLYSGKKEKRLLYEEGYVVPGSRQ